MTAQPRQTPPYRALDPTRGQVLVRGVRPPEELLPELAMPVEPPVLALSSTL